MHRDPRSGPTRAHGSLPDTAERLLPWLGAAVVVAGCNLAVALLGVALTPSEWATMLVGLAATLAAAGLVASRSRRETDAIERDERARPATDQLRGDALGSGPVVVGAPGYVDGMARWTTAILDLLDHARTRTEDPELRLTLAGAAEDTRALNELLRTSTERELSLNEAARLHSVCALWETGQDRIEGLAAGIDPRWHRRWCARAVVDRRLRHGHGGPDRLVLPYRS